MLQASIWTPPQVIHFEKHPHPTPIRQTMDENLLGVPKKWSKLLVEDASTSTYICVWMLQFQIQIPTQTPKKPRQNQVQEKANTKYQIPEIQRPKGSWCW